MKKEKSKEGKIREEEKKKGGGSKPEKRDTQHLGNKESNIGQH